VRTVARGGRGEDHLKMAANEGVAGKEDSVPWPIAVRQATVEVGDGVVQVRARRPFLLLLLLLLLLPTVMGLALTARVWLPQLMAQRFANAVLVIITQYGKIGSMVRVSHARSRPVADLADAGCMYVHRCMSSARAGQ
jgi:hypothetical protein